MMPSEDVAALLTQAGPGVRFRQATIVTWDANSGANTLDLAGGILTNVPVLNTGEAIALKAGHTVGLLGQGRTWFIIGRVTPPGSPDFAGASLSFGTAKANRVNFGVAGNSVLTNILTAEIIPPAWADEALVTVSASASVQNTLAAPHFAFLCAYVEGLNGTAARDGFAANTDPVLSWGQMNADQGLIVPLAGDQDPIVCEARMAATSAAAWPANPVNDAQLVASAIFRSTT